MAKQNRSTIKTYFETGDVPTQSQFGNSFDSQVFWNDDVKTTTAGNSDDEVPTTKAVNDAIAGAPVPTLQEVTTAGAVTTDAITTGGLALQTGVEYVEILTNGQINVTPDTGTPINKTSITFATPIGNNQYTIPDKGGATDTFAMLSDITAGAVDSVNGQTGVVVLTATDVDALKRDGSNANSDVDLGAYALNAKSIKVNGTGGTGHVSMKHQSSGATAATSESVIYADNSGNPQWKNDGSAVEKVLLQSDITQTITNGVTTKAPSEDAVFDALALKANLSQAAYSMLANNTSGTANMSAVTFKSISKQTYSGSITWTGTTAPSGTPTQHSYSWIQVGNVVSFYVCLVYPTAGVTLSQVAFSLPSDMPTPLKPDGISAVTDIIAMCSGQLSASNGLSSNIARAALRIDSANSNAFQFVVASSSANYRQAWISGVYFTS